MRTLRKVLIANRGEIAVRIARTCRALGIGTVAVYSDPDREAVHVRACDEAVGLGGATSAESYLRPDALLEAAARTGADAVHPGYGFLAENAEFARAVLDAGLVWIGPSPEAIAVMGDKLAAKARMREAGVPVLESIPVTSDTDLQTAAREVGLPVLVKAAAGGGGKGMRVVRELGELADAVEAAQREAGGAFGDERVFLERYLERPRHIEVQILGDEHGEVVHLFERECSIQRRHQKVVEESPSPALTPQLRKEIGDAAVAAGRAIGYANAGTVEFIYEDGAYHFLEVNTRLQVEHPVTEAVVRVAGAADPLDLVRLQLLVARGERLPFAQDDLRQEGHAIEVRLYAEDPANDYLPATGTLHAFDPGQVPGVRWDSGVETGSVVSPHYDPMLAKVIGWARTREEAAARVARALETTLIDGVRTNRDLLVRVLRDEAFLAGDTTTTFLPERYPQARDRTFPPTQAQVELAAIVATFAGVADRTSARRALPAVPSGFSNAPLGDTSVTFVGAGHEVSLRYARRRDGTWTVVAGDGAEELAGEHGRSVRLVARDDAGVVVEVDGHRVPARVSMTGWERHVLLPDGQVSLVEEPRFPERSAVAEPGATLAPMPGSVVSVHVEEGQAVDEGDLLVVVEAMKMEHRITAPHDGTVSSVRIAAGDQVDADEILVVVDPAEAAEG